MQNKNFKILVEEHFKKKFEELTKKDKKLQEKILKAIAKLSHNPRIGKPLSYELSGKWSLRIGKYRIIYEIDEKERIVYLLIIDHRSKIYSEFS